MKEDILFIKEQIESSIEYLKSRGTQVTVGEALQEPLIQMILTSWIQIGF